ncbi:MAG TPA: hypothetical protein VHJ20_01430 [Polyangia bacterium]|nr:hypothetical protein [Polyangia bacterium]
MTSIRFCAPLALVVLVSTSAHADAPPSDVPLRLAVQTEGAIGVGTGAFYNQLAGARLDGRFSPHVSLGGYLGYANLKGKEGRASAALAYAQLEYLFGAPGSSVRVPLRFASGYLSSNGPIVRASTGLDFALTPKVDLVTELFAPTVWLTNHQTLLSLDLALEVAFTF